MIKKFMIVFFISIMINVNSYAYQSYTAIKPVEGSVTATTLSLRKGPSTSFAVIEKLKKNQKIRVIGKIGTFYIVQTQKNVIGAASSGYIKIPKSSSNSNTSGTIKPPQKPAEPVVTGSTEEEALLKLINAERVKNGLQPLKFDSKLMSVARIKAQDMVSKNYFAHESPTYGNPFQMMQKFGVTFKTAGENIAGNSSLEGAVKAWMNSPGHRQNILNSAFNYTGLGIVADKKYGKILVQMFIGK